MTKVSDKLFVYGTLLDEDNKYGIYLRDSSKFFAAGKIKGKLYDIGEYPAAVLSPEGENYIHGIILQMDEPDIALSIIDIYEGFGEGHPDPNEFIRVMADIQTNEGAVACWIYLYNLPTDGLTPIQTGKYIK